MEKLPIEINGKIYTLLPKPFGEEINIADYLKIDYHNIFAELITMPLVLNQIANMKAEIDNRVLHQKTGLEILRANLEKECKRDSVKQRGPTLNDLEEYVLTNEQYQKERELFNNLQKQAAYLDSFYWSAKAKIDSLQKISDRITPDEFNVEMLEKSINNVIIKKFNGKL